MWVRRWMVAVLAVVATFGGVLVLPAAAAGAAEGDGSGVSVGRFGGADRYVTSLQVAEAVATDAGGSLDAVVLVSGRRWTDAVVAAPLAGSLGVPVLMTPPGELRADALEFLERVGVSSALVVGPDGGGEGHGPGRGVSAGVFEALAAAGIAAERVAGDDRYGTGVAAAGQVTAGVMGELGPTAVIASGDVFADALVAGPFAARGIHPVLLSPPEELHANVAAYLGEADIKHVVLMGGTAALSEAVEQSVEDLGIDVTRVAGSTRYDTATKAAELVNGRYNDTAGKPCFANDVIGIARARVPFDSFSAAPLLGRLCAPLVLADHHQIPTDTVDYLDTARKTHDTVSLHIFGGDAAISQTAINAYLTGEDPGAGEAGDEVATEDDSDEPVGLPAGACGGSESDPVSRLDDDPTSRDPAWSPDCTKIVFSRQGSLYVANTDGSDAQRIVSTNGAQAKEPKWSPDGTRIAYAQQEWTGSHWESHIWAVNADGTDKTQLTSGDVFDALPSWSPDGERLVFEHEASEGRDDDGRRVGADRYVAVIASSASTTGEVEALTEGDALEWAPVWSPDGTSIAFIANGIVWVIEPDGTGARQVAGGAFNNGGVAWSPDGASVAYSRSDGENGANIVTVEVDGVGERQVTDLDGWAVQPEWSPDSQRIAFTHHDQSGAIDDSGTRYASVVGARSGTLLEHATTCRPTGRTHGTTAGFPLPDWAPSARGTVRVAVLFMDFPDAQATHTTHEEIGQSLEWAEEYLEKNSYRKFDIEFVPLHRWLRAEQPSTAYFGPTSIEGLDGLTEGASEHAFALADEHVDFSTLDLVLNVFPSSHFGGGNASGAVTADGVAITTTRVNTFPVEEIREPVDWGDLVVHELMHTLGLLDMYPYDDAAYERPEPPDGQVWTAVNFGRMGLGAYFLTADDDERLQRRGQWAGGGTWTDHVYVNRSSQEMLAWSRWQLGWLHERQAACVTGDDAIVTLAPIARTGGAVAMAAVPINRHEIIVIESRRRIGYDRDATSTWPDGGSARWRALLEEGVLVYTVDTFLGSGQLPVKIAGDAGNGQVDDFPVLQAGESVTVLGWTITVTADDGDTHTVSIKRHPPT